MDSKKITYLIVFLSLFCLMGCPLGLVFAADVSLTNYGPANFCVLLTGLSSAVAGLVGVIGTIMIIIAGILYLVSAGNQGLMGMAKTTLICAVAGMVIAMSADIIISTITGIMRTSGSC